jgi:hypothetical protein
MKSMHIIFIALCILLVPFGAAFGQITTNGTGGGDWSNTSTWAGGVVPDGSGTITIAAGDSVVYDVPVTITGTLVKSSGRPDNIGVSGSVTFANGSTYNHAVNKGTIPLATWATGSTCLITGVADTVPSNNSQAFYNFTWSCPAQNKSLNLTWGASAPITINGTLTVTNSGTSLANQFRLCSSNGSGDITINGGVVVNPDLGYVAYLSPTGGASTREMFISVLGDVSISGGASTIWAVCNNSGATWTWKLYGNLSIASACSLRLSGTGKVLFSKSGTQTFSVPSDITTNATALTAVVVSGATLDMGTGYFGGGTFTVEAGAGLISASPTGLDGNIRAAATKTFDAASSYTFNGSEAQVTGTSMPATVKNVTINNAANVTSSQALTITDTLFLVSGSLLGTYTAGTTTDVEENIGSGLPGKFFVNQNYPNPFNPSTTIMYGIPKASYVSVKVYNLLGQQVATLFSGYQAAGTYPVTFKADQLSSGVYLYRVEAGQSVEVKRMLLLK